MATFVTRDLVRLEYTIEGDGPPLLLHLGSGCDSELWRAAGYLDRLTSSHRCIVFDHRGHGKSHHPAGAQANHIDRFVADVVALLDHLELDSVAFWAYSTGMLVGLKVAEEHPDKITALIGNGAMGRRAGPQLGEMVRQQIAVYREHGWEKLIAGFDEQETAPVPEWMKARIRATDIDPVIGWLEARPDWNWSALDAAPSVAAPTLFVVGALEDPDDFMQEVASSMPNATRVRLEGLGHINAFLASNRVLPYVTEFLSSVT